MVRHNSIAKSLDIIVEGKSSEQVGVSRGALCSDPEGSIWVVGGDGNLHNFSSGLYKWEIPYNNHLLKKFSDIAGITAVTKGILINDQIKDQPEHSMFFYTRDGRELELEIDKIHVRPNTIFPLPYLPTPLIGRVNSLNRNFFAMYTDDNKLAISIDHFFSNATSIAVDGLGSEILYCAKTTFKSDIYTHAVYRLTGSSDGWEEMFAFESEYEVSMTVDKNTGYLVFLSHNGFVDLRGEGGEIVAGPLDLVLDKRWNYAITSNRSGIFIAGTNSPLLKLETRRSEPPEGIEFIRVYKSPTNIPDSSVGLCWDQHPYIFRSRPGKTIQINLQSTPPEMDHAQSLSIIVEAGLMKFGPRLDSIEQSPDILRGYSGFRSIAAVDKGFLINVSADTPEESIILLGRDGNIIDLKIPGYCKGNSSCNSRDIFPLDKHVLINGKLDKRSRNFLAKYSVSEGRLELFKGEFYQDIAAVAVTPENDVVYCVKCEKLEDIYKNTVFRLVKGSFFEEWKEVFTFDEDSLVTSMTIDRKTKSLVFAFMDGYIEAFHHLGERRETYDTGCYGDNRPEIVTDSNDRFLYYSRAGHPLHIFELRFRNL